MVMGPTHAMSGAAAGLAMAAVLPPDWGGPTTVAGAFVFAGVTAGAALLPDLDSPQATIARSFGPVSQAAAHVVENCAQGFCNLTRSRRDDHCNNGHRTATHTVLFAVAAGILVAVLVSMFGKAAAVSILFFMLGLALRGLFPKWSKKNDWLVVTALSAAAAVVAWATVPDMASGVALGMAVAVGVITHLLGDSITKMGVPALAPIVRIKGKSWYDLAPPGLLRISASGPFDKILLTVFTGAAAGLAFLFLSNPAGMGVAW